MLNSCVINALLSLKVLSDVPVIQLLQNNNKTSANNLNCTELVIFSLNFYFCIAIGMSFLKNLFIKEML